MDATNVYWVNQDLQALGSPVGSVATCPIAGCNGAPTILASGQGPMSIAVDAKNVYWPNSPGNTAPDTVMECAIGGCGEHPTVLAANQPRAYGIAAQPPHLYWYTSEGVVSCGVVGCAEPTVLAWLAPDVPTGLVADATGVYWTIFQEEIGNFSVITCPLGGCGGSPTIFASVPGKNFWGGVAVDGANVYWTAGLDAPGSGTVFTCPIGGCNGQPTTLASGQDTPLPFIAVDATSVYWATGGPEGAVMQLTPK